MSKGRLIHFHVCKGRISSYKITAVGFGLSSGNRIAWDGLSAYRMGHFLGGQRPLTPSGFKKGAAYHSPELCIHFTARRRHVRLDRLVVIHLRHYIPTPSSRVDARL